MPGLEKPKRPDAVVADWGGGTHPNDVPHEDSSFRIGTASYEKGAGFLLGISLTSQARWKHYLLLTSLLVVGE